MQQWQPLFYEVLEKRFADLKAKNSRFSIRAYARMAGVSPGRMSGLLKQTGEWNLTPERAVDILSKIKVSTSYRNKVLMLSHRKVDLNLQALPLNEYTLLTNPLYMPLVISFDLEPAPSVEELSLKLDVSTQEIRQALEQLIKLGHLVVDTEGKISRQEKNLTLFDQQGKDAIRQYHADGFALMQKALQRVPAGERDISSMTFAGSKNQLEQVREEIRNFYTRIYTIMDSPEEKNEVFKFCIGITPYDFSARKETE